MKLHRLAGSAAVVLALMAVPLIGAPTVSSAAGYPVIGVVGDMSCDPADPLFNGGAGTSVGCRQRATSNAMLADTSLNAVVGLGDYQYQCDDLSDFAVSYSPTWGRLNSKMNPVAGNHEYETGTDAFGTQCPASNKTASTYFTYFGNASRPGTSGHFSFDLGTWHLIGLNGNCYMSGVGGCSASSPQTAWLKADLAATTQPCVLAFWHQPLFTGISTGKNTKYKPWWDALYAAHADVVLNGHIHNYQRFAPMSPTGVVDGANGLTQYIVGTGGEALASVKAGVVPAPVAHAKTFGYVRMTLGASGWKTQFVNSSGALGDSSTGVCH